MLVAAADGGIPVRAIAADLAAVAAADVQELLDDLEGLVACSRGLGDDQGRVLVEAVQAGAARGTREAGTAGID